jgi:hypothetical protein
MSFYNRTNKSEAETMARRVFAFHEPLERTAYDLRGKSGAIVLENQLCGFLLRAQSNMNVAPEGQMSQFVFEEIAHNAAQQG